MKKNGFSLAEVLITLGIVGFIAAVTLPSLQINVEKQKVGPALMKAVNTLEVANSVALQVSEAATLNEIGADNNASYLRDILYDYTKLVGVEYDGGTGYSTKDGIVMVEEGGLQTGASTDSRTSGSYYVVKVDVNGLKGPNIEGRDIFKLYVDTLGLVIPYGSKLGKDYATDWTTWDEGCPSNVKGAEKVVPTTPASCAGSIVDNGGKILYFFEGISGAANNPA